MTPILEQWRHAEPGRMYSVHRCAEDAGLPVTMHREGLQ